MLHIRLTTLAYLLLELSPFVLFEKDFVCFVTGIHFGIFRWYLAEMYNRTRQHVVYKNDNSVFLTFGIISLYYI